MHIRSTEHSADGCGSGWTIKSAIYHLAVGESSHTSTRATGSNKRTGHCAHAKLTGESAVLHREPVKHGIDDIAEKADAGCIGALDHKISDGVAIAEIDATERSVGISTDRNPSILHITISRHSLHVEIAHLAEVGVFRDEGISVVVVDGHH